MDFIQVRADLIRLLENENSDMKYATSTYLANDRVWVRVDLIISDSNLYANSVKVITSMC